MNIQNLNMFNEAVYMGVDEVNAEQKQRMVNFAAEQVVLAKIRTGELDPTNATHFLASCQDILYASAHIASEHEEMCRKYATEMSSSLSDSLNASSGLSH